MRFRTRSRDPKTRATRLKNIVQDLLVSSAAATHSLRTHVNPALFNQRLTAKQRTPGLNVNPALFNQRLTAKQTFVQRHPVATATTAGGGLLLLGWTLVKYGILRV